MATEIERKFLVKNDSWRPAAGAVPVRQGYICLLQDRTVRVRIAGERAFLTVKKAKNDVSRLEYEYQIPANDAAEILEGICDRPLIEKMRHTLTVAGRDWTIDVFEGENAGLVIAEIELDDETQRFELPSWAGAEVTQQARYFNANLSKHPYRLWTPAERKEHD